MVLLGLSCLVVIWFVCFDFVYLLICWRFLVCLILLIVLFVRCLRVIVYSLFVILWLLVELLLYACG